MEPRLSVVVITLNEAAALPRLLRSVAFADEVIVVDSHSTDGTVELARSLGARTFTRAWEGYGAQKNFGLDQATGDWILSLDADETMGARAAEVIRQAIREGRHDAYYLPRRNHFAGRFLRHGGQYPDRQLRLFRRGITRYQEQPVHERVIEPASTGTLVEAPIEHESYRDLSDCLEKFNRYTSLEAETRARWSAARNVFYLCGKPPVRFVQRYLLQLGFLDGFPGFALAVIAATYALVVQLKIAEKRMGRRG